MSGKCCTIYHALEVNIRAARVWLRGQVVDSCITTAEVVLRVAINTSSIRDEDI
jgi:hypothetical protein